MFWGFLRLRIWGSDNLLRILSWLLISKKIKSAEIRESLRERKCPWLVRTPEKIVGKNCCRDILSNEKQNDKKKEVSKHHMEKECFKIIEKKLLDGNL